MTGKGKMEIVKVIICYMLMMAPTMDYGVTSYKYWIYNKSRLSVNRGKTMKIDKRDAFQDQERRIFLTLEREGRVVIPKFPEFTGSPSATTLAADYISLHVPMARNQSEHIGEEREAGRWSGDVPFGW